MAGLEKPFFSGCDPPKMGWVQKVAVWFARLNKYRIFEDYNLSVSFEKMLDPQFFISGIHSPFTRPASPNTPSPVVLSSGIDSPYDVGSPEAGLARNEIEHMLIKLQIHAFSEQGIGNELDSL